MSERPHSGDRSRSSTEESVDDRRTEEAHANRDQADGISRRDALKGVGAVGLLGTTTDLGLGQTSTSESASSRWALQYVDEHRDALHSAQDLGDLKSDERPGHHAKVGFTVNYLDAEWVKTGNPLDPGATGASGCWKHTFEVSATTFASKHLGTDAQAPPPCEDSAVVPRPVLSKSSFEITTNEAEDGSEATTDPDSRSVAVETRRDRDLFSLVRAGKEQLCEPIEVDVPDDGSSGTRQVPVAEALSYYLGGQVPESDVEWNSDGQLTHDEIDEEATEGLQLGLRLLSTGLALVSPPWAVAAAVVALGLEWADQDEYDPHVRYDEGFYIEYEPRERSPLLSTATVFDVYVAPEAEGTVTLTTGFEFEDTRAWSEYLNTHPKLEIEFEGPPASEADSPESDAFTATPKFEGETVDVETQDGDTYRRPTWSNIPDDEGMKLLHEEANDRPTAVVVPARTHADTDESIHLDGGLSWDPDGRILDYEWAIRRLEPTGEADWTELSATGPTATVGRAVPGRYEVRLTVTDDDLETDATTVELAFGEEPTASLSASPDPARVEDTVEFTASTDADDPEYRFRFYSLSPSEGFRELETTPFQDDDTYERSFPHDGVFRAEVVVEDENGIRATASTMVDVFQASDGTPPVARFDVRADRPVPVGTPVTLDASPSSDPDGTVERYDWVGPVEGTGKVVDATFPDPGTSEVTLVVEDDDGLRGSTVRSIEAGGINAAFTAESDGNGLQRGDEVTLDASPSRYAGPGTIERYEWSGDVSGSEETFTTTVGEGDALDVTLRVEGSDGATDETSRSIPIVEGYPPSARISPRETTISPGEEVTFDASDSTDPDDRHGLRFEWRVDGGEWQDGQPTRTVPFDDPGTFQVSVRVTDRTGHTDEASATVHVDAEGPNVDLAIYRCRDEGDVDLANGDCEDRESAKRYHSENQRSTLDNEPLVFDSTPSTHPNKQGFERYEWSIEALYETEDRFEFAPDHQDEQVLALTPEDFRHYLPNGNFFDGLAPGRYEVTLTIEDGNGVTGSASEEIVAEPYLYLRFTDDEVAVGEEFSPTLGFFGPVDRQAWDVERIRPEPADDLPGLEAWEADPTEEPPIALDEPGTYRFSVTQTYPDHEFAVRDTATIDVVEPDPPGEPAARVSADRTTITPGDSVAVDASDSREGTGEATYEWSVENTSTEDPVVASPSGVGDELTLHQLGTHEVAVTVTDETGASDTATTEVVVAREPEDGGPVARIDQEPLSPWIEETVWLDGRRSYGAAGIESHEWRISRQSYEEVRQRHTGARVSTTFDEQAVLTVELTVTDADGNTDTTTETVFVYNHPEANAGRFDVSPEVPHVGDEVTFDASDSFSPDGIDEIVWEVGNSRFDDGVTATRTFDEPGTYTIDLRTRDTDEDGFVDFENGAEREIVVAPAAPPTADVSLSATEIATGDPLTLDGGGSSDDHAIETYDWTVRPADSSADPVIETSGRRIEIDAWGAAPGTFEVELEVTDVTGRSADATETFTVAARNEAPVARIEAPDAATVGEHVTFDGRSSADPDGSTLQSHEWTVERDGSVVGTSTGSTLEHTFESGGEHAVSLTVTDEDGASDEATVTVDVSPLDFEGVVPQDVNGDGFRRDFNADGSVTQADVTEFFSVQHRDPFQNNPEMFDFNENGNVGLDDVVHLFTSL